MKICNIYSVSQCTLAIIWGILPTISIILTYLFFRQTQQERKQGKQSLLGTAKKKIWVIIFQICLTVFQLILNIMAMISYYVLVEGKQQFLILIMFCFDLLFWLFAIYYLYKDSSQFQRTSLLCIFNLGFQLIDSTLLITLDISSAYDSHLSQPVFTLFEILYTVFTFVLLIFCFFFQKEFHIVRPEEQQEMQRNSIKSTRSSNQKQDQDSFSKNQNVLEISANHYDIDDDIDGGERKDEEQKQLNDPFQKNTPKITVKPKGNYIRLGQNCYFYITIEVGNSFVCIMKSVVELQKLHLQLQVQNQGIYIHQFPQIKPTTRIDQYCKRLEWVIEFFYQNFQQSELLLNFFATNMENSQFVDNSGDSQKQEGFGNEVFVAPNSYLAGSFSFMDAVKQRGDFSLSYNNAFNLSRTPDLNEHSEFQRENSPSQIYMLEETGDNKNSLNNENLQNNNAPNSNQNTNEINNNNFNNQISIGQGKNHNLKFGNQEKINNTYSGMKIENSNTNSEKVIRTDSFSIDIQNQDGDTQIDEKPIGSFAGKTMFSIECRDTFKPSHQSSNQSEINMIMGQSGCFVNKNQSQNQTGDSFQDDAKQKLNLDSPLQQESFINVQIEVPRMSLDQEIKNQPKEGSFS